MAVDYYSKTTWKNKKCNDFMGLDKYMKGVIIHIQNLVITQ